MGAHAFGIAWVLFAVTFATHFTDEALHGFLPEYNSRVRMIRKKLPLLPVPTFSFAGWLAVLIAGFVLLLGLLPLAFHGSAGSISRRVPLPLLWAYSMLDSISLAQFGITAECPGSIARLCF